MKRKGMTFLYGFIAGLIFAYTFYRMFTPEEVEHKTKTERSSTVRDK